METPKEGQKVFEKYGQNVLSALVLAGILWIANTTSSLEKQAIRQEAETKVQNFQYAQLAEAVKAMNAKVDMLQSKQDAMALDNASKR